MAKDNLAQKGVRKASRRPVEALSWVGECSEMVKRSNGLESWPFPTFKGQPLEPVKYPRQLRVNPEWSDALL
jgi:hypothetical protein